MSQCDGHYVVDSSAEKSAKYNVFLTPFCAFVNVVHQSIKQNKFTYIAQQLLEPDGLSLGLNFLCICACFSHVTFFPVHGQQLARGHCERTCC